MSYKRTLEYIVDRMNTLEHSVQSLRTEYSVAAQMAVMEHEYRLSELHRLMDRIRADELDCERIVYLQGWLMADEDLQEAIYYQQRETFYRPGRLVEMEGLALRSDRLSGTARVMKMFCSWSGYQTLQNSLNRFHLLIPAGDALWLFRDIIIEDATGTDNTWHDVEFRCSGFEEV